MKHDGWATLDTRDKGWVFKQLDGWTAVYPMNDLRRHKIEYLRCPCDPTWDPDNRVLVHYAFDGRDLVEQVEMGHRII